MKIENHIVLLYQGILLQAKMYGLYIFTDASLRHWSQSNKDGEGSVVCPIESKVF